MDTLTHALSGALEGTERLVPVGGERALARQVLDAPEMAFFGWFAESPALYRIDRGDASICVWFEDLRFDIPGRGANPFRFGMCRHDGRSAWRAFRLRDDGAREPAYG